MKQQMKENPLEMEFELFALFEMTPDLVCITGRDGYFKRVNSAVINTLEYAPEEIYSRPVFSFLHPDDLERTSAEREKLLSGKILMNLQNRYISKSGKIVWLQWTSVYHPEKEIVFGLAKDITVNKLKEMESEDKFLRYKGLAAHFKSRVEKDKRYFAYELHEQVAQMAAVLKMQISWMHQHSSSLSGVMQEKVNESLLMCDLLIGSIRKISYMASPNMLDDLGFNDTMHWLCKEFTELNGIPCGFTNNCQEQSWSREIKIDCYRICQEALSNVMEHAQAENVEVTIEETGNHLSLSVKDDGIGFEVKNQLSAPGLMNMRQLALSVNGELSIESIKGMGTSIRFMVKRG